MLSQHKVDEIRQLLSAGAMSQRKIARHCNVSRGSVAVIASGRWNGRRPAQEEESIRYDLPPVRCRGCGGMVYAPCRVCRLRRLRAFRQRLAQGRREDQRGRTHIESVAMVA